MNTDFNQLLNQLTNRRPSQQRSDVTAFFFNDHLVMFQVGEMLDIHWVDIMIELPPRFRADNLNTAKKLLSANKEMGVATPIPSWFACGDRSEVLFVNRLDWRHITAEALEGHILGAIDQISDALKTEGA